GGELLGEHALRLAPLQAELEHRLLTDQVERALLVRGGEASQLVDYVARAGGLYQRLGHVELVDAVLDDVARRDQVLEQGIGLLGLQRHAQPALQVEAELQGRLALVPRLPEVEHGRDDRGQDEYASSGAVHATGTSTRS